MVCMDTLTDIKGIKRLILGMVIRKYQVASFSYYLLCT